ncbi:MAG: FAD-dependent monooxygenase, partial [Muribaculaceae bacterium]|nr:FAD-dependent monooxygenase [Muribaculaceae bacterium]
MSTELQIRVEPHIAYVPEQLLKHICATLGIAPEEVTEYRIVKRSIDARQRRVMVNLTVKVFIGERAPQNLMYTPPVYHDVTDSERQAIVVGAGPAGLFCALRLLELGIRPIVLERGKDVDERRKDMARIARENVVDPDSNYCFGEGGAGAYSDGKLYTRSKKRGSVDKILGVFHAHGASDDILIDAHPHIGTDRLPEVIKEIRQTILRHGGNVEFGSRVEKLIVSSGRVCGVVDNHGREYLGPVVLATGHSARDVYQMLQDSGIKIEAKGIAVGVR